MLFSVIVPIYKVEKYLQQCVGSILSQTFTDFELILVDDGSPDKCPQMCDEMAKKDERIVVIHKKNGGLSDARNVGIRAARGKYIVFADSDDFYATNIVFETISKEIRESDADVVQFHRKWFYESDNIYIEKEDPFSISCKEYSPDQIIRKLTSRKMIYFSAYQNVIKKSHFDKHDLCFLQGIKSEDIEWGFRLFSTKPSITLLPDSFYVYRAKREGSITSSIDYKHLLDYCGLLESSIGLIENGDKSIHDALMSHAMYHVTICSALVHSVKMERKEKRLIQYRLSKLCKDRMAKYTLDGRVKKASIVYRILGYNAMSEVLGIYLTMRKKGNHSFSTVKTGGGIT